MCGDRHWTRLLKNTKNQKHSSLYVSCLNEMGASSELLRREPKKTQQTGVVLPKLQRTYRIRYFLVGKSFKHGWQIHQKQGWSMGFWWFSGSACASQWLRDRIWQTIGKSAREGENPVKGKSTRERDKQFRKSPLAKRKSLVKGKSAREGDKPS